MNRYFQPEIECADPEKIKKLQSEKLVKQIHHVWNNVPYYRAKMEAKGVTPDDIHGVEDLNKLPFLSKADLKEAYPFGLMGCKKEDCVRIHSTSGTTGKRVIAFYTQHDAADVLGKYRTTAAIHGRSGRYDPVLHSLLCGLPR